MNAFRALHDTHRPLLLPNPWDTGSARLLATLGFAALATTSSGAAAALGRLDGTLSKDEALAHAAQIAAATPLPVNGDLENGFADDPDGVAATVEGAIEAGLAGCSIEDWSGSAIYEPAHAAERIAAAARAASGRIVLTARAENLIRGVPDLDDTIARLLSYQAAGADVLYAPGLADPSEIAKVLAAIDRPLNVLARPGVPPVAELAALGVARVSVGGAFAFAALARLADAAAEFRNAGTYSYVDDAMRGVRAARAAFG